MVTQTKRSAPGAGFAAAAVFALAVAPGVAGAASLLGSATSFAVLAATAITAPGASSVTGDIGLTSAAPIAGLSVITLDGTAHAGDAAAAQAIADATFAAAELATLTPTRDLSGQDLGTVAVLTPGVYHFDTSAQLTGNLTLDFAGMADQPFVFQIGTTLTTAQGADVIVVGGGPRSQIYWQVGTSATLGGETTFAGNVLADQSITLGDGSSILFGRALALQAAVTLKSAVVSLSEARGAYGSSRPDFSSLGFSGQGLGAAVPEPQSWALMLIGLGAVGGAMRRTRRSCLGPV
jgi:type VI secretion system secreted protein VgrG